MAEENKKEETPKEEAPKKEEAPTPEKKEKEVPAPSADKEVPKKFKDLVKQIEELSVLELAELVKVLEDKFGVSVPQYSGIAPAAGGAPAEGGEEKSIFDIELKSSGDQKISVIKVVKEITDQGLKEAKEIVDSAPKVIKQGVKKEEAEEIKKKLEEAGATVELK